MLCFWLAALARPGHRQRVAMAAPDELAESPGDLLAVPIVRQTTEHSCGPAALMSVLEYWQITSDSETTLHSLLETTPEFGTAPEKIVEAAARFGLRASMQADLQLSDLAAAVGRGETVIVNFQAWPAKESGRPSWQQDWEDGHYAVLIGLDGENAYLMDPWVGYGYLSSSELVDRWHDYTERAGKRIEYHHLAIFVQGETPRANGPLFRRMVKVE
jgi:predicted double-glycine peptidase